METIHLFVELLDQYFSNVCEVSELTPIENSLRNFILRSIKFIHFLLFLSLFSQLDIVFHFNKVYAILDEYILAGEVQETNKRVILDRMKELEKLE